MKKTHSGKVVKTKIEKQVEPTPEQKDSLKKNKVVKTSIQTGDRILDKHDKVIRTSIEKPAPTPEDTERGGTLLSPKVAKTKLVNEEGAEYKKAHHGKVIKTKIEHVEKVEVSP